MRVPAPRQAALRLLDASARFLLSELCRTESSNLKGADAMSEDPTTLQSFMDARALPAHDRLTTGSMPASPADARRQAWALFRHRADDVSEVVERRTRQLGGARGGQISERALREREAEER